MKEHPRNGPVWRRLNAMQQSFKKVVNTLYGTFASIYFAISSPCVANNTTDRCRMACFALSSAGYTINSVTDGGESILDLVMHWIEYQPSLGTIAHLKMPDLLPESTRRRHFTAPLGACTLSREHKAGSAGPRRGEHTGWEVDANGMITGPGLDQPSSVDTSIIHIERLYDAHIRQYFTLGGRPLPEWFDSIEFECKLIGLDIAVHGSANYAIGPLPRENRPPLIKSRGHRLRATHYNPDSGDPMESPMLTMMLNR